ncbi:glycosyltransferase family 4 protein [Ruegeria sp. HKCCA5491]|uniref:glycosyltransferase family 4 protein n=1 Tax=Ruegeria sp. HKCCA5491 TaxID=2682986 RepID=UPI0014892513|nr:glycosyltransferase family 4 protein [Ruegeria sp. HKCCA5491]
MSDPRVIAPNLKRRLSGVTATIARLVPLQVQWIDIAATGPGLPADIPHIPLSRLPFLSRKSLRVWHARRNTEMLLGLFLRNILRLRLKLLFTSASQRSHSGYTKWLIGKMDAVVATSRKTAGYLDRDAQVIMHGINLQDFTPPEDKAAVRTRLGLPDGLLLGCYGRIRQQKGTDAFVDAMIELCGQFDDVHGIVMGRATEKHTAFLAELKDKVAAAGLSNRILFMPEVTIDQIAEWYQVLDLFIAPQRWEGFGLTPLEAMACGVPVVATDVGAFSEIVTDPTLGRIIPPGDIPAMVDASAQMLKNHDSLTQSGRAARAHVEQNFDINGEAKTLVALYERLLTEN